MLTDWQKSRLFHQLSLAGWAAQNGEWVSPQGALRLSAASPWQGDLVEFLERMRARLSAMIAAARDNAEFVSDVQDTASLVRALSTVASKFAA
jgi:methyl-accepting chemotaxis protein